MDLTLEKFYNLVDEIERTQEITIHTTTIDPWNELTEDDVRSACDLSAFKEYEFSVDNQAHDLYFWGIK